MDVLPLFPCYNCGKPLDARSPLLKNYLFNNELQSCPYCKADKYVWYSTVKVLKDDYGFKDHICILLDGLLKFIRIELGQDETLDIDLEKVGIPLHAHILSINFTPKGDGVFPLIWSTNTIQPRHNIPNKFHVYGARLGDCPKGQKVEVGIAITYSTHNNNDLSLSKIYAALQAFLQQDYGLMGLDANIAIEEKLKTILNNYNPAISYKKLGFETSIFARLSEISRSLNLLDLDDEIKKIVTSMRNDIRNKRGHESEPITISREKAAEIMAAVIFCYIYLINYPTKHS
jgi:hypothetical protein